MRSRLSIFFFCVAIAFLVLSVFNSVLRADFVLWDDDINIYKNPHLGGLDSARLVWMFTDFSYSRVYNPMAWLTWSAVYELFGLEPFGFHLLNLLLHVANAVLVFLVLRKALRIFGPKQDAAEASPALEWSAALAALIWALHPLQVEPVAWATAIGYVQGLFFLLLSVLSYLHAFDRNHSGLHWLAVGLFAASLLTYPVALGAPVLFMASDWLHLRRTQRAEAARLSWLQWRQIGARNSAFVLASVLVFGITLYAREITPSFWKPPPSLLEFGLSERVGQSFYGWAYYLWRPFLPSGLAPYYTSLLEVKPLGPSCVIATVLVAGITIGIVLVRRRWSVLVAAWVSYLCLLMPLLGIFEHPHFTNDRYFYVVSVLLAALVAAGLLKGSTAVTSRASKSRLTDSAGPTTPAGIHVALGNWKWLAVRGVAVGLAATLGLAAHRQTSIWRNSETLFSHLVETLGDHPSRANFWVRLGGYHGERGEFAAAEKAFRSAIAVLPDAPVPQLHLGQVLAAQGKLEDAATVFSEILNAHPDFDAARSNLARVREELRRSEKAVSGYEATIERQPSIERNTQSR